MGYVIGNQYGVMTVNDEKTINEPKHIRFINSNYDLLFTIPDNDFIQIKYRDGVVKAYQCRFLDDYHFATSDGRGWHICEFAETMERIGATYAECPEKHIVWSDMNLNIRDWRDFLSEEYGNLDDDTIYETQADIDKVTEKLGRR